jgi:hypothetical protein
MARSKKIVHLSCVWESTAQLRVGQESPMQEEEHSRLSPDHKTIVLKTEPVIEPVRLSV